MIKSLMQAKKFLARIKKTMNKDLKNMKISPLVHESIKIEAAINGVKITDLANLLLTLAMSKDETIKKMRQKLIEELKRNI